MDGKAVNDMPTGLEGAVSMARELLRDYLAAEDGRMDAGKAQALLSGQNVTREGRGRTGWEALEWPPLDLLTEAFQLDGFERCCLTLALLPDLDAAYGRLYGYLQGPGGPEALTASLALRLWSGGGTGISLGEDSPLVRYLFERAAGERSPLRLCCEVRNFLLGLLAAEASWRTLWRPEWTPEPVVGEAPFREMAALTLEEPEARLLFFLHGPPGSGKRLQVRSFSHECGQAALFVDAAQLVQAEDPDRMTDRMVLCAAIWQAVVCLERFDRAFEEGPAQAYRLLEGAARVNRVFFILSENGVPPESLPEECRLVRFPLEIPGWEARRELWRRFGNGLRFTPGADPDEFANKFSFTPGQIKNALAAAGDAAARAGREAVNWDDLGRGCREQLPVGMGGKAVRVTAAFGWDDLILPDTSKKLLQTACDQVRYRHVVYGRWGFARKVPYGRGLSMLFSGPPGTGKTMGAQVAASCLGLELYKVDLSAVVSKYIGETEKNLAEIFQRALRCQAVLFFDEADALFARRMEVKDSNDRYGNLEASFLLQRMEEYDGICILATNYAANLDEAFKRRIRFYISFPFPDAAARAKIWMEVFPAQTPIAADVDWDFLAGNFELSGGSIKNAALNAAFLAASADRPVDMRAIVGALKFELGKSGKSLSREDLGEYRMLLEEASDEIL